MSAAKPTLAPNKKNRSGNKAESQNVDRDLKDFAQVAANDSPTAAFGQRCFRQFAIT
jgi:hypothetical protein